MLMLVAQTDPSDLLLPFPSSEMLQCILPHDPKENPNARPYGTPSGHIADAGHALAQIIIYLDASGIDIQESMEVALDAIRDKDCLNAKQSNPKVIISLEQPGALERLLEPHGLIQQWREKVINHMMLYW